MMSKKSFALAGLIIVMSVFSVASFAQTWSPANAPSTNWSDVVSSADGTLWFASAGATYPMPVGDIVNINSAIYCSTNSGLTWQPTRAPVTTWSSIACSADGTHVGAGVGGFGGPIYISQDSGNTWNLTTGAPSTNWRSIASSAAGDKWVAAGGSVIYTSTDYGNTWISNNIPAKQWRRVASSADGDTLFTFETASGSQLQGSIYVSTNSGVTWTPTGVTQQEWNSLACSADGTRVVAGPSEDLSFNAAPLYISSDSGNSWTTNATPTDYWCAIASSADGSKLVAVGNFSIYSSTDGGITWTSNNAPPPLFGWEAVGSSADGSRLAAASLNGGLYIVQSPPAPLLHLSPSNGQVTVSWVVPSTNFVLQQSSDLSSWSNVTNTRTLDLNSLQYQINASTSDTSGFYRLATP